jgi:hypothetical protein
MRNVKPLFDPTTHYRIELRGRVDVDWLRSFDGLTEINTNEIIQIEDITMLNVYTDQPGIVGLVRRPHGLGITILQLQVVSDGGKAAEVEGQH